MLDRGALQSIVESLRVKNSSYANLLESSMERQQEKSTYVIGVVGDDLVGKSTIINSVLGEDLIPTSVIPNVAEITIRYGSENKVFDETGVQLENYDMPQLAEESTGFTLETNNEYLNNYHLEIREFHGFLSRQKINDMELMANVYKCDAIIVVMSAEHLLSESECAFIDNYIKYVGAARLLIVINKLSSVEKSDIGRILEYAASQINSRFKDVRWLINNNLNEKNPAVEKYATKEPKEVIPLLFKYDESQDDESIRNVLRYISGQLETAVEDLQMAKEKNAEEIEKERNAFRQQREIEQTFVNTSVVEFKHKSNETEEAIDKNIRAMFEDITSELLQEYEKTPDKIRWYENELDNRWRASVSAAAERVDGFIADRITEDIDWLNRTLETTLGANTIGLKVSDNEIKSMGKLYPYSNYKKFAVIGMGGGVVLGYCLFRLIGAVVGFGGGLLVYTYMGMRESVQNEEIKRNVSSKVRDISEETRRITKKEIEKLYVEILDEYKREAEKIIDAKYSLHEHSKSDYDNDIEQYKSIISKIKEV